MSSKSMPEKEGEVWDFDEEKQHSELIPLGEKEDSDGWSSGEDVESTLVDTKILPANLKDILEEQRKSLQQINHTKNFINSENIQDSLVENNKNHQQSISTEKNKETITSESLTTDRIFQTYQNLICNSEFRDEEVIQQKSTSTKRLIHPNKVFGFSIMFVCILFGIVFGFIVSHFTIHSIGFILVIILTSILLIGLGLWFGATETIEERVIVTQVRLPANNLLSKRAINLWKSSECQSSVQQQNSTLSKVYVNNETRERFADKEEDEIFDADISLGANRVEDDEDFDFSDSSEAHSEDNDLNLHLDNQVHVNFSQQKPKPIFVDTSNNPRTRSPVRKVKRNGEKDYLYFGVCIPSYINGKWIPSYSDDFENFKQHLSDSNVLIRDDLVGQRNSILPNIRLKKDEDYRSSKTFTDIEMDNIKNNVNQHREELYNFGVDNTHYDPVIAPFKVRDLCKIRKLVLKFE